MIRTLTHAPNSQTGLFDLAGAAESAGLEVRRVGVDAAGRFDLSALIATAGDGVAYRCAGGPLAAAISAGAPIRLVGATAQWFAGLPVDITGRAWLLTDVNGARAALRSGPAFVKLAEAKFRSLPARRYTSVADFDAALSAVHARQTLQMLVTHEWLAIASEYRVFTSDRTALAWSPYLVHDDPWTPLLRTHRASFHDEAAAFVDDLLTNLPDDLVPPTAVLDVARLEDHRFVVLEVNHVWTSGLYGCEPGAVLAAVIARPTTLVRVITSAGSGNRTPMSPDSTDEPASIDHGREVVAPLGPHPGSERSLLVRP